MTNANEKENGSFRAFSSTNKIPMKKQINKLKFKLLKLEKEEKRKDKIINEIMNCTGGTKSTKEIDRKFDEISSEANVAVLHAKMSNIQNELLTQIAVNEENIKLITGLRAEKKILQEANARQKTALETLKEDMESFNKFQNETKSQITQYLQTIEQQQKLIDELNSQLEFHKENAENFNIDYEDMRKQSIKVSHDLEVVMKCISDGEPVIDVQAASEKINRIFKENEALKSQLSVYQKQVSSFECEQEISRETIIRLSNEVILEKSLRTECIEKLNIVTQKLNVNTEYENCVRNHITCLATQLSEMRKALMLSLEENLQKSEYISKLKSNIKTEETDSDVINNIDFLLSKAREILDSDVADKTQIDKANLLIQCIRKLNDNLDSGKSK